MARIILSWFPHKETFVSEFLKDITDPILLPVGKLIPPLGGIDFSPIIAFLLLRVVHSLLVVLIINLSSTLI
jgi:YggT family protein